MMPTDLMQLAERYVAERGLTDPRSRRAIRHVAASLSAFLERPATTDDLRIETARSWLAERAKTIRIGGVRENARKVLTLWRWAATKGLTEETFVTPKHLMPDELRPAVPRYRRPQPLSAERGATGRPRTPRGKAPRRDGAAARLSKLFGRTG